MLNPLPAIALLPMAMLWFGLGADAIVFTLLHSVVWPVALNMHTGFMGVSETQRMVGRNYGLRGIRYVVKLLIPAAFPSILTGMKIGWAYAWRTLIAAELVFGGAVVDTEGTGEGGLGWFIFANQMDLQIPFVFAGLFTVILVGITVENVVFRNLELRTVGRWGDADDMSGAAASGGKGPDVYVRPEFVVETLGEAEIGDVERKLSGLERAWNVNGVRKATILIGLVVAWQVYTVALDVEPLMFPRFSTSAEALWLSLIDSDLLRKIWFSVSTLLIGYTAGLALSAALVLWASAQRIGADFLSTCTAMFNPLPAIALLPLAMLWFGLGTASIVFVTIHSVLWAVALSTPHRLPVGERDAADDRAELRAAEHPLRDEDPDPRGVAVDPVGDEDRLGVLLAHPDRRRAGLRRLLRQRRPRLVHLREQPEPRDRARLRGPVHRDPHRDHGRERHLQERRAAHRVSLGDAALTPG